MSRYRSEVVTVIVLTALIKCRGLKEHQNDIKLGDHKVIRHKTRYWKM